MVILRESKLGMQRLRRSTATHVLVDVSLKTLGLLAGAVPRQGAVKLYVNIQHTHLQMSFDKSIPQVRPTTPLSLASSACDYAVGKAEEWRLG